MAGSQFLRPGLTGRLPYRPAPRLHESGLAVHDAVAAAEFPETILRYRNDRAAASVGLDGLGGPDWIAHFGRFTPLPDNQPAPLALRYHGHQFRSYNPDLGDGRGFLFAQLLDDKDRLLDLGTKGTGKTPYSRGGDGRLTLKGGVREVLATAMLEALGVTTSKSFSLIETGEALMRGDEPSPTRSSVLVRLSHSHIRFGTFERLAYHGDTETMQALADFVIANYYALPIHGEGGPRSGGRGMDTNSEPVVFMFDACVSASARLAAQWMAAGFVHGVLNTDNMNITGESFDYGPYRFLPHYDPGFTAAYFDHTGLYAYGRQPDTVLWNLSVLAQNLSLIAPQGALLESLQAYAERYRRELGLAVCARLHVRPKDDNGDLIKAVFAAQAERQDDGAFEAVFHDMWGDVPGYEPDGTPRPEAPVTLLIGEIEAIWARIAEGDDWSAFYAKLDAIEAYRQALRLN